MDEQEFLRLAELYSSIIYRIAFCHVNNRADADDIMQDVFLSLFTCGKEFKDDEHIKAWLIRVTINKCKNLTGSYSYRSTLPLEEAENIPSERHEYDSLLPILMKLKPKYRIAMYMYYYEGYSVKETARILSETQTAITTRLARGRKQLKELLIKEGYDEL